MSAKLQDEYKVFICKYISIYIYIVIKWRWQRSAGGRLGLTGTGSRGCWCIHSRLLQDLNKFTSECADVLFYFIDVVFSDTFPLCFPLLHSHVSSHKISHDTLIPQISLRRLLRFTLMERNLNSLITTHPGITWLLLIWYYTILFNFFIITSSFFISALWILIAYRLLILDIVAWNFFTTEILI